MARIGRPSWRKRMLPRSRATILRQRSRSRSRRAGPLHQSDGRSAKGGPGQRARRGDAGIDEFEVYAPAAGLPARLPSFSCAPLLSEKPLARPTGPITAATVLTDEQYEWLGDDFRARAKRIASGVGSLWDEGHGMYFAASKQCRQTDIWGSAFAVYVGLPDAPRQKRICRFLAEHYDQIVYAGQVRHLLAGQYWEKAGFAAPETYQNGAYWGTASGWVAYAIAQVDPPLASRMLGDMIDYYQKYDAYECVNRNNYRKFAGYAASVGNPLDAVRRLREGK